MSEEGGERKESDERKQKKPTISKTERFELYLFRSYRPKRRDSCNKPPNI